MSVSIKDKGTIGMIKNLSNKLGIMPTDVVRMAVTIYAKKHGLDPKWNFEVKAVNLSDKDIISVIDRLKEKNGLIQRATVVRLALMNLNNILYIFEEGDKA